jgi:hypothetical protein
MKININFKRINTKILNVIFFIILWILFGFNNSNPDYLNYQRRYDNYLLNPEPGFRFIIKVFNDMGFNFQEFLLIISFISLFLIIKSIKNYTNKTYLVLFLYFVFPFFIDVVQIRNFLSMVIVFYSFKYLLSYKTIDLAKYILLVILASTIHYSALFYLIFVIIQFVSLEKIILITILFVLLFSFFSYTNILYNIMDVFFDSSKVLNWFSYRTNFGFIIPIFLQIISLFPLIYIFNKSVNKGFLKLSGNNIKKNKITLINNILKINFLALILFIFYIYNTTFFRLYRNILLLNYSVIIYFSSNYINIKIKRFIFLFLVLITSFSMSYIFILNPYFDSVFITILKNNILFK